MSLTARWLTINFERQAAVLNAIQFDGPHIGEAICAVIKEALESQEIPIDHVHLILRDNASNMIKGMREANLPDYGCFAHTLQLVVHDGVLSQRVVIDMITTPRKVASHFRCSNLVYSNLRKIQTDLKLLSHRYFNTR